MKLFDNYEAVKFPQENMIFITNNRYLYYYYDSKYKHWHRYRNAGNDMLTVYKYPNVSKKQLADTMGGKFPGKWSDLLRLLYPSELTVHEMITLLNEDYPEYMHDYLIRESVRKLLRDSEDSGESFEEIRKLFNKMQSLKQDNGQVELSVRELSLQIMGRDIFSDEIVIVDGHDSSSYFWIMPVRVRDNANTNQMENVFEMRSNEISIEEDDVYHYLTPFLYKYFDMELDANRKRIEYDETDDDGNVEHIFVDGFEWNLTNNFFTHESMMHILDDISSTILDLESGKENEFIAQIRENGGFTAWKTVRLDEPTEERYTCKSLKTEVSSDTIIDFYRRFTYRMEYMMKVGKEKGYDLISFMGP